MVIQIELPQALEDRLGGDLNALVATGREALLVELYRQGKLTQHELAEALGLGRFQTHGVLKRHNVTEDLLTPDELDEQLASLQWRERE